MVRGLSGTILCPARPAGGAFTGSSNDLVSAVGNEKAPPVARAGSREFAACEASGGLSNRASLGERDGRTGALRSRGRSAEKLRDTRCDELVEAQKRQLIRPSRDVAAGIANTTTARRTPLRRNTPLRQQEPLHRPPPQLFRPRFRPRSMDTACQGVARSKGEIEAR